MKAHRSIDINKRRERWIIRINSSLGKLCLKAPSDIIPKKKDV